MKTFKDEVFCPACGAGLAPQFELEVAGEPPKQYVKRNLYLYCTTQNCPLQHQRQELPEA